MSAEHTPGPWTFDQDSPGRYAIFAKQGPITVQPAMVYGLPDARLIAAAPDLLAALQEIAAADEASMLELEAMGIGYVRSPENVRLVELARAAIAKATMPDSKARPAASTPRPG